MDADHPENGVLIREYAKQQAQLTGVPEEGARRALQQVADTYAEAGITQRRFKVAPRFDRSFNTALPSQ